MAKIDYYRHSRKHPNTLTRPNSTPNATLAALPQLESSEIEYFLYVYKTQQCYHSSSCFLSNCKFYHDETDQRRVPSFHPDTGFSYSEQVGEGGCLNGLEELYHPMKYKTELCGRRTNCGGKLCPYAHGTKELRHPKAIYSIQGTQSEVPQYTAILAQCEDLRSQYRQIQLRIQATANRLKCFVCHFAVRTGVASCCGALVCQSCTPGNESICRSCGETGQAVIKLVSGTS